MVVGCRVRNGDDDILRSTFTHDIALSPSPDQRAERFHVKKKSKLSVKHVGVLSGEEQRNLQKNVEMLRVFKRTNRLNQFTALKKKLKDTHKFISRIARLGNMSRPSVRKAFAEKTPKHSSKRYQRMKDLSLRVARFYRSSDISMDAPDVVAGGKRYMRVTVDEAWGLYQQQAPTQFRVSSSYFGKLRPVDVKKLGDTPTRSCLCGKCSNVELKGRAIAGDGINGVQVKIHQLLHMMLCPTEKPFHNMRCLRNPLDKKTLRVRGADKPISQAARCGCGPETVRRILYALNCDLPSKHDDIITYRQWEKVTKTTRKGKQVDVDDIVVKEMRLEDLIDSWLESAWMLAYHHFMARWQHKQFRDIRMNLRHGHSLKVIDFAQNFLHKYQDEVQSSHWEHSQTTVFPCVNYFRCPNRRCSRNVMWEQLCMSPCKDHDHFAVSSFLKIAGQDLEAHNVETTHESKFSDNMGTQFKSKGPFMVCSKSVIPTRLFYTGEDHGKTVADGSSGRFKMAAARARQSRQGLFTECKTLYEHADKHMRSPEASFAALKNGQCPARHYLRSFYMVPEEEMEKYDTPSTGIPGTKAFHDVRSVGIPGVLETREVACGCNSCVYGTGDDCPNTDWVDSYFQYEFGRKEEVTHHENAHFPIEDPGSLSVAVDAGDLQDFSDDDWTDEYPVVVHASDGDDSQDDDTQGPSSRQSDQPSTSLSESSQGREDDLNQLQLPATRSDDDDVLLQDTDMSDGEAELISRGDCFQFDRRMAQDSGRSPLKVSSEDSFPSHSDDESIPVVVLGGQSTIVDSRGVNWDALYRALQQPTSFDELKQLCNTFRLPVVKYTDGVWPNRHDIDSIANDNIHFVDGGVPKDRLPLDVQGDGNCLYRAMSMFISGREGRHIEFRCRVVVELAVNEGKYTGDQMANGAVATYSRASIPQVFAQYTEHWVCGTRFDNDGKVLSSVFRRQVMSTRQCRVWCGLWELSALANVLNRPIRSYYPGNTPYCRDFNRTFLPFGSRFCRRHPVYVMWTPSALGAQPQHFVPLLRP